MLILTAKVGESVRIGDAVRVEVVDLKRRRCRLGVEAPRDVPIIRDALSDVEEPTKPNSLFDSDAARLEWVRLERYLRLLVGCSRLPDPISQSRVLMSVSKEWLSEAEKCLEAIDARMRGAA